MRKINGNNSRGAPRRSLVRAVITVVVSVTLFAACAPIGPRVLSSGRPLWNIAVQETESQQLLLNIIRQRYSDPIMFLDVTSISSGFNFSASTALSGDIVSPGKNKVAGVLGASASESPNIIYSPNSGEKFVRQMLTPMDLRTVALVLQAGWSIERMFLLVGESFNQVRNSAAGLNSNERRAQLLQALSALRQLQKTGLLSIGVAPVEEGEQSGIALVFSSGAMETEWYKLVCETLETSCDGAPIYLKQAVGAAKDGESMTLTTRSLFSTLYFLSQGVEAPAKDLQSGNAEVRKNVEGGPFDWNSSRSKLFRVHSSENEPENAAVKVFYRGSWFYIADNDADSKVTFALLSMLMTLQSGDTTKVSPMLTLPLG